MARGKERSKLGPCQDKRDGTEVGMHRGAGGAVSGDDDGIGKSDGETGGDDGVGWMGQVICIYPYVPLIFPHNLYFTHPPDPPPSKGGGGLIGKFQIYLVRLLIIGSRSKANPLLCSQLNSGRLG